MTYNKKVAIELIHPRSRRRRKGVGVVKEGGRRWSEGRRRIEDYG